MQSVSPICLLMLCFFFPLVNVMRCSVCHQDYKQSDIIDNYFVKDTTEATSTSDEKAAQVFQKYSFNGDNAFVQMCLHIGACYLTSDTWRQESQRNLF